MSHMVNSFKVPVCCSIECVYEYATYICTRASEIENARDRLKFLYLRRYTGRPYISCTFHVNLNLRINKKRPERPSFSYVMTYVCIYIECQPYVSPEILGKSRQTLSILNLQLLVTSFHFLRSLNTLSAPFSRGWLLLLPEHGELPQLKTISHSVA